MYLISKHSALLGHKAYRRSLGGQAKGVMALQIFKTYSHLGFDRCFSCPKP